MLDLCAPGHVRKLRTHHYWIMFGGKTYPSFPKGAHGKANPPIEKGHIKKMARFFGIDECAKNRLGL